VATGPTTAVVALSALGEPPLFDAVSSTRILKPTSVDVSV
jgi:hypothetical protein